MLLVCGCGRYIVSWIDQWRKMSAAFFSYSRQDTAFALKLASDLRKNGAEVWLDQLDIKPGERWDQDVQTALTKCASLLVILSPASVDSINVMDEVGFALEGQKLVIPVLYRDCEIPFRLRRVEYVDLRNDYEKGLQELLKMLHPAAGQAGPRKVAATEPETRSSGSRRWLLPTAGVAAGAVLGITVWIWSMSLRHSGGPSDTHAVELPNVVGMTIEASRSLLAAKGFTRIVESKKASTEFPPGAVVGEEPVPGTTVPLNGIVRISVAAPAPKVRPATRGVQVAGTALGPDTAGSNPSPATPVPVQAVVTISSAECTTISATEHTFRISMAGKVSVSREDNYTFFAGIRGQRWRLYWRPNCQDWQGCVHRPGDVTGTSWQMTRVVKPPNAPAFVYGATLINKKKVGGTEKPVTCAPEGTQ